VKTSIRRRNTIHCWRSGPWGPDGLLGPAWRHFAPSGLVLRRRQATASAALAAEYALVVLGMLLFQRANVETPQRHAGPAVGVLCYALAAGEIGRRTRAYLIGTLIAVQVALRRPARLASGRCLGDTGASLWCIHPGRSSAGGALVAVLRGGEAKAAAAADGRRWCSAPPDRPDWFLQPRAASLPGSRAGHARSIEICPGRSTCAGNTCGTG